MNKEKFLECCEKVFNEYKDKNTIGILAEKNVHSIIKYYIESDEQYHEIKIGSFFADICKENHIYEIQTRSFNNLRKKLDYYLPKYDVTIVYPIDHKKVLLWEDKDTGLIKERNKSHYTGKIYKAFKELYKIKSYLSNPHLHLKLLLIDLEETRVLDGYSKDKKHGCTKLNKYPTDLYDEVDINTINDYAIFIPEDLNEKFTSKEFSKCAKISRSDAQVGLNILKELDIIKHIDIKKREYVYKKNVL